MPVLTSTGFHMLALILTGFIVASATVGLIWTPNNGGKSLEQLEAERAVFQGLEPEHGRGVMSYGEDKRRQQDIRTLGVGPEALMLGLLQICLELCREGVLDAAAIARVKRAIGNDLSLLCRVARHENDVRSRLDQLFGAYLSDVSPCEVQSAVTNLSIVE